MDTPFPKVLIIGNYFELSSGGGITMTNLFKGWDKEKIAVASERINNPDYSVCNTYFQLGYSENKRRFPFSLWQKQDKSGLLTYYKTGSMKEFLPRNVESKKKEFYNKFLHFFGLYHYTRRLKLSPEFTSWLQDYSPDIIYSQLSSLETIKFVYMLNQQFKLPAIIHIMDDWPSTISKKGILQSFWKKKIDKEFRLLLDNSKKLMSISDAMSDEYLARYGKTFTSFHNPINVSNWIEHSKISYNANETFVILYAGRIGTGIESCFFDVTGAIEELIKKGLKIEFHLQTNSSSFVLDTMKKFDFVKIKNPVSYDLLPVLFASADLLLLPNDFDRDSVSFLRFSMPTKASEYMATGTPILLYASSETAVVKHAEKNNWAYIVKENNKEMLVKAIAELYSNNGLREKIGNIAKKYAINNYSDIKVNQQFRQAFN